MTRSSRTIAAAASVGIALGAPVWAQPLLPLEVERFIADKVNIRGFVENATGVSISHGSRFFDTCNRLVMNRFTIQPEINAALRDDLNLFASWRFVKEPRYSM